MEARAIISSSGTGRPSVSYNMPSGEMWTPTETFHKSSDVNSINQRGGGAVAPEADGMVFNTVLDVATPSARCNQKRPFGKVVALKNGRQVVKMPCLSLWEHHAAKDPVAANILFQLRSLANSVCEHTPPSLQKDMSQRQSLAGDVLGHVGELLSSLENRALHLVSEAECVASQGFNNPEDSAEQLCNAIGSIEWLLHCRESSFINSEFNDAIHLHFLGVKCTRRLVSNIESSSDRQSIWSTAIACVYKLLAAAQNTVKQMAVTYSSSELLGACSECWRKLGEITGRCVLWTIVDQCGRKPARVLSIHEIIDYDRIVAILYEALGLKGEKFLDSISSKAMRLFLERFNSEYFGGTGKLILGNLYRSNASESKSNTNLTNGLAEPNIFGFPSLSLDSIGAQVMRPDHKNCGRPVQFKGAFSTEWNAAGMFMAACTALGLLERQQIRPGKIPIDDLLCLEKENPSLSMDGKSISYNMNKLSGGDYGRVLCLACRRFVCTTDLADMGTIEVMVNSAEKWLYNFYKRSSIEARGIREQIAVASVSSKRKKVAGKPSLAQILAHNEALLCMCCACIMDASRLLSIIPKHQSETNNLVRIQARLYLLAVEVSSICAVDAATSLNAINTVSAMLLRCCDAKYAVLLPQGYVPDTKSQSTESVKATGALLLRSVVESIVSHLRNLLALRGSSCAKDALSALEPCVVAALDSIEVPSGAALAKELLRGLSELAAVAGV